MTKFTGKLNNMLVQSTSLAGIDYAKLERHVLASEKHTTSTTDEPIDEQMKRIEKAMRYARWYGMGKP